MNEEVGYSNDGPNSRSLVRKRKNLQVSPSPSHNSADLAAFPTTRQRPGDQGMANPIRFLCSESFVDQWSDLVAVLATKVWQAPSDMFNNDHDCIPERRIGFIDTSLMDLAGIDVENGANGAMIFCLLSATIGSGFPHLLKRVIDIASLSRYTTLEVILCIDINMDSSIEEIAKLQNATMQYQGMPTTAVSFNLVSPTSLASFTAESLLSWEQSTPPPRRLDYEKVERLLGDRKTWERLLFLLSLIPSLCVTEALVIAQGFDLDEGETWLTRCLERGRSTNPTLNQAVMQQLSFVLSTPLGPSKR